MEMADTKLKSQENMDLKHPRPIEETNNHSESKIIEISEGNGNLKAPLSSQKVPKMTCMKAFFNWVFAPIQTGDRMIYMNGRVEPANYVRNIVMNQKYNIFNF